MTTQQVFTERYNLVAEANRRNYAERAKKYASTCGCLRREQLQRELDHLIEQGLETVGDLGRAPIALDACGGSGNAALKLIEHGCETTLADISPELVEICRKQCADRQANCFFAVGEIGHFLLETERTYDLVVFSSALHHLEDPFLVLSLAAQRLSPGGVIVTMFDPCPIPRPARLATNFTRIINRVAKEPSLLFTRTGPVLRRMIKGQSKERMAKKGLELTDKNVGFIAEYHGSRGINDRALATRLTEQTSLIIVQHKRYIGGQINWLVRGILRLMRAPNRFSFILQRPR